MAFSTFVSRSTIKFFLHHLALCQKTQETITSEFLMAGKGPHAPRHVQFISLPVREAGPKRALYRATILDITERKEAEVLMGETQNRFRQFAENIREVFWITDLKTKRMIYISPGYLEIWGRTSYYESPDSWLAAIMPEDREDVLEAAQTKQLTGQYNEIYRIRRADGNVRWIHERAFPLRDESGQIYRIAGIADDITERKMLEKELIEISDREQCRFGQDLHDGLCQHLAGIEYLTQMLKANLADKGQAEADQAAQISMLIGQASAHAHDLARGLSPVPLEAGGLMSALQELAATVERLFRVKCDFVTEGPVPIHDNTVATHLYRIAQEAVTNAIKHGKAWHITITLTRDKRRTVLSIKNDGVEMTEDAASGTGLGGHIMHYRASMIGGVIELRHGLDGFLTVVCSVHSIVCSVHSTPTPADRRPQAKSLMAKQKP
ncbi:MAG: PAS domain-containing protein [Verrucomicrobia bacterium]|nr:PAS domain-containing protein [Verrucomicrobiota bacterium]